MSQAVSASGSINGHAPHSKGLAKSPTGIAGLDEITGGGVPQGRTTLVCGSAGCGKTLFAMEFLVRGATQFGEPGVCMTFEETGDDLTKNIRSLGFDLDDLVAARKVMVDFVKVERSEIDEAGEYNLDGLFIRLGLAIDAIGAKRVVLDTLEALFSGFSNQSVLRSELRRLFGWLKEKGVTAVITGERGDGQLTRQGLEEYVSDCVILLDHRVNDQVSTRRLRIVKYRGTSHGTNEYPFLIDEEGISVVPLSSLGMGGLASEERISSGIPRLDEMLGGKGFFRGSSVLISGTAGTGKSSLLASAAVASCERGERVLYFALEESEQQVCRNMASIGLNLKKWVDNGLLKFHATRPGLHGLEMHLATMHKLVRTHQPAMVVVDPISGLIGAGTRGEAAAMLVRLIDFLKASEITAICSNLTSGDDVMEGTDLGLSSIVDTWILLRDIELAGERNRGLYVLKSRGMAHSNQIREFLLTSHGIDLLDVYVGQEGVLTGSMRLAQEAREKAKAAVDREEAERLARARQRKKLAIEAQIAALQLELQHTSEDDQVLAANEVARVQGLADDRKRMSASRQADAKPAARVRKSSGKERKS
ncbi:Circadian clock protein kinase KaiC [Caulifigura coniformis]|uniref:non-specific serine/threonine protein kinase n=1 Tax=Caulifigura coniformis TaxID=2527983 RepID=A0A517SBW2_9PLAN|nr:circadian clock protein KaiC [Caulifigura coniformis]QDT53618.1 Circadian clock protein kinase KaiC [Caulifigura coniformis]